MNIEQYLSSTILLVILYTSLLVVNSISVELRRNIRLLHGEDRNTKNRFNLCIFQNIDSFFVIYYIPIFIYKYN